MNSTVKKIGDGLTSGFAKPAKKNDDSGSTGAGSGSSAGSSDNAA